jgi:hypothetical protein
LHQATKVIPELNPDWLVEAEFRLDRGSEFRRWIVAHDEADHVSRQYLRRYKERNGNAQ